MSYVTYQGKMLQSNHKYVNKEAALPPQYTILGGTTPDALILRSINSGTSFAIDSSSSYGNPLSLYQRGNGDILYGTSNSIMVNYTQDTSVKPSGWSTGLNIKVLTELNGYIFLGTQTGQIVSSLDGGLTFPYNNSLQNTNEILRKDANSILAFAIGYIWTIDNSLSTPSAAVYQAGNFLCAYDNGDGFYYAGEDNFGSVWRNTNVNDYTTWTNLGNKAEGGYNRPIYKITKANGNFIVGAAGIASDPQIRVFDSSFNFISGQSLEGSAYEIRSLISVGNGGVMLAATSGGNIHRSTDYGLSWVPISGNPQQSQTSINCLLKIS